MKQWVLVLTLMLGAPPAWAARYTLGTLISKVTHESPAVMAARAAVVQKKALLLEQQLRWLPDGEAGFSAGGVPRVRLEASDEQNALARQLGRRYPDLPPYVPPQTLTTVVDLL